MNTRNIQITFNILLIIFGIIGFIFVFSDLGIISLEYYTELSNLMLLISSVTILIFLLKNKEFPRWLEILRYVAVVSTTLTLFIVITVLSWTTSLGLENLMFHSSNLYHHTLCPVIALLSFIILEKYDNLKASDGIWFTLAYAIVMIILNYLKIVEGPYPFLRIYSQPLIHSVIWFVVIVSITYIISLILKKGNGKVII